MMSSSFNWPVQMSAAKPKIKVAKPIRRKPRNTDWMHHDGVMSFFTAACVLAAKDYRAAAESGDQETMVECSAFFLQHPFMRATHTDGRKILKRLDAEIASAHV